jgi:hypothetical protein
MASRHKTSRGVIVDIDQVRLANEDTIAIGNAKTNARGDQLGSGGKVVKTKAQVMQEYHNLNTDIVQHDEPVGTSSKSQSAQVLVQGIEDVAENKVVTPVPESTPVTATAPKKEEVKAEPVVEQEKKETYVKPRGSFAESVAQDTQVVEQEKLEPANSNKSKGISRI